jgi:beta-N-acetylhexosaminidase
MAPFIPRTGGLVRAIFPLVLVAAVGGCAWRGGQSMTAIALRTSAAQEVAIDGLLGAMSPAQKVGQLLMIGLDAPELTPAMGDALRQLQPGGVIVSRRNVRSAAQLAALMNALQRASLAEGGRLPLLIAADQEGGAVSQIPVATEFPDPMALAAGGSEARVERVARIIGAELRAVGIGVNLAPVLDVNTNPLNPVIGIRSFGDDPATVARFGRAYIRGLHAGGVIAVAKHFPGHGGTDTDTHVASARIDLSEPALERGHLVPFRAAVDEGIDMVMPAHLAVPALSASDTLPVTYSRRAITDVLRGRLGFGGAVITDSLQMTAAALPASFAEACVRAVKAGADILLLPGPLDDASGARADIAAEALLASLAAGRPDDLQPAELDAAVRRVLRLKKRLHDEFTPAAWTVDEAAAARAVASESARALAEDAAVRGLAWLSPPSPATSRHLLRAERAVVVSPVPETEADGAVGFGETFARGRGGRSTVVIPVPFVRGRRPPLPPDAALIARVREEAPRADAVVVGLARPEHLALLAAAQSAVSAGTPVVVVVFGNPYPAQEIRPPVAGVLATFSVQHQVFGVAGRALLGDVEVTGRPPVTMSIR